LLLCSFGAPEYEHTAHSGQKISIRVDGTCGGAQRDETSDEGPRPSEMRPNRSNTALCVEGFRTARGFPYAYVRGFLKEVDGRGGDPMKSPFNISLTGIVVTVLLTVVALIVIWAVASGVYALR